MAGLFISVLNMSLTGSAVIIVICLIRVLLRKFPKNISYVLWIVAGYRLIVPFTIQSIFSLLPFQATIIPADIGLQAVPSIESGFTVIDHAVNANLPAAMPYASINPMQVWIAAGSIIWLLGMASMFIYSFTSIILLKRKLCSAIWLEDNIYLVPDLKTPFVMGFLKPKIYLPDYLPDEKRQYIVLHEQMHIQRHDPMIKMIAYFILCLHWFNPFVWIAFILMSEDMEMSCDNLVIKKLGENMKKTYSLSLVQVAAEHRILNGSPLAFGEGSMKKRVKNVLHSKILPQWMRIGAWLLAGTVIVGCAMNRVNVGTVSNGDYQPQVWLDFYDTKEFPSNDIAGRTFPEFPGVEFYWTPARLVSKDATKEQELILGMPIWNIYMADLTGDGFPELCATVSMGSGFIDERIVVYDYKTSKQYELTDRGYYDYVLFLDSEQLMVKQIAHTDAARTVLATGVLALVDGKLDVVWNTPQS